MTYDEFCKLPFRLHTHLNMGHAHASTYVCTTDAGIMVCVHTPYKDGIPGRSYRHYRVHGKVYKSKKALIDAIANLDI